MRIKQVFFIMMCLFFMLSQSVFARALAPEQVEGALTVSTKRAKSLMNQGVTFIDVRGAQNYEDEHIQWAIHLDVKSNFTKSTLLNIVKKNQPVVFYCNGEWCRASSIASQKAIAWGWQQVFYYRGGIPEWEKAGFPLE